MTVAAIQAELDPTATGRKITILKQSIVGSTEQYYAIGGVDAPGKARWTSVAAGDSAATKAAAITASLQA